MSDPEALRRQLQAMVEKGQRALHAAEEHLAKKDFDFASSKAYYAVFHLMQAALLTKGLTFSKHAGVISGFSEHCIKPGIFPPKFGEAIQKLRKDRELGDYGYQLSVEPEESAEDVKSAQEIIIAVIVYLEPFVA